MYIDMYLWLMHWTRLHLLCYTHRSSQLKPPNLIGLPLIQHGLAIISSPEPIQMMLVAKIGCLWWCWLPQQLTFYCLQANLASNRRKLNSNNHDPLRGDFAPLSLNTNANTKTSENTNTNSIEKVTAPAYLTDSQATAPPPGCPRL